ncbi:MAG: hypothetical protein IAE90_07205 [Ignavibacteria bacterium]|nr:hypothetical protein [Ignavibacteria bacterium]
MPKRTPKTDFPEELKLKILKIAKFGFSESDTALLAKISTADLRKIKGLDPDFGRDYKKAELEAQFEAEAAFHNRACGYQTTEVIFVYIPSAEKDPGDNDAAGTKDTNSADASQELLIHSETICGNEADIKSEIRQMIEAGLNMKLKEVRFVKKFLPPDTSSCNSWLINRRSERWSKNPTGGGELDQQELARLRKIASAEIDENS